MEGVDEPGSEVHSLSAMAIRWASISASDSILHGVRGENIKIVTTPLWTKTAIKDSALKDAKRILKNKKKRNCLHFINTKRYWNLLVFPVTPAIITRGKPSHTPEYSIE